MPSRPIIPQLRQAIEALSLRDRIRRVALYGSHARGTAHAQSDIDLVVEFGEPVDYLDLMQAQRELEQALRAPVDLVTPDGLSPYLREDVLREAVAVYGA
jgi:predicted nucleotidyltransferase